MARRATRLSASATPALADALARETPDDSMSLDVPDQLLTPETSRSETSSNNENLLAEEKPPPRRRSTRAVRASLQATEALENSPAKKDDSSTSSSQAYVDNLAKSKRSRSGLRHSIAVMESEIYNGTVVSTQGILTEEHPMAPGTPVSNSSQNPSSVEMDTSLQHQTLRNRVGKALAGNKAETTLKRSSRESVRRSSRLSFVEKASDMLDRASSVLGKRPRHLGELRKDVSRRASLRPRNLAAPNVESTPAASEPALKKRRVSESDLANIKPKDVSPSSEEPAAPAGRHYKPKMWLKQGLYTGQEPTTSPPKQRRSKNSEKTSTGPKNRRILPMPMFAGARLIQSGRDYRLPFDIFSPLPPGQPKPDEWRKTNKNVFVGDAASEWKANKNLELSTCMCTEEYGCDENCQNRYMFYECDNGNCRLGPECGNRSFNELKHRTKVGGKYNIGVEVIKTSDRGYGVRSNRSFEPNQIIVEYTGEIITQFECEKRMRTVYKTNECYYLMYFDQNMIIDATRGSIARFVNHACEPNCRMEKWTVAGKPRMALFAGDRGIMTGEELSYDYNFDPYSNKNVQQCRCGSENCRGILGPRPKDKDQRAKIEAVAGPKKAEGTKRKRPPVKESASARQGKKRKLLAPKSIKTTVKKVMSKATTSRTKANPKAPAASTAGRAKASARDAKLPVVKRTTKATTAVRMPQRKTQPTKAVPSSPAKTSQLKRPSVETKKQILAAAARGGQCRVPANAQKTGAKSPRQPAARKASKNSPVRAHMPASKGKSTTNSLSSAKGKGLGSSVKTAARKVVRTVRGTKK